MKHFELIQTPVEEESWLTQNSGTVLDHLMASSVGMFNFNSTILAVIPIRSPTFLAEIVVGIIFAILKTYETIGFISANAAFRGVSWD